MFVQQGKYFKYAAQRHVQSIRGQVVRIACKYFMPGNLFDKSLLHLGTMYSCHIKLILSDILVGVFIF